MSRRYFIRNKLLEDENGNNAFWFHYNGLLFNLKTNEHFKAVLKRISVVIVFLRVKMAVKRNSLIIKEVSTIQLKDCSWNMSWTYIYIYETHTHSYVRIVKKYV